MNIKLLLVIAILAVIIEISDGAVVNRKFGGVLNLHKRRLNLSMESQLQPQSPNIENISVPRISNSPFGSIGLSPMLKINTLMVLFYSSLGAVMPYIPLYYRKLGVSDAQIGILGAITPAVTFVVSPLWGALADSTGSHKSIMILTFIGSVLSRCLMSYPGVDKNVLFLGIAVAVSAALYAPVKPLLDSAVLASLADKSSYGKSRLFGQIGFGLGSFLVGPLLATKIQWMFLVQTLLALPTTMLMTTIPSTPKAPVTPATITDEATRMKKLRLLLRDPTVIGFFFAVFLIGLSSGIIENFAYVKIAEVSGTGTKALTVSRLLSSLAGGPMFWLSGQIIKSIGTKSVLTLTILSYVVRFAMYASITRGWHAIPAEVLRGVTFALFWSAATTHVYDISPVGVSATMLGLLNGIYGGLGQSIGSLIGGDLVRASGISAAFYKCAVVDGVILLGFGLVQLLLGRNNGNSSNGNSNNRNNNSNNYMEQGNPGGVASKV